MEQRLAIGGCALERGAVGEIADDELDGKSLQIAAVRAGAHQHTHLPAVAQQCARDRRAHESGRAGDERPHAASTPRAEWASGSRTGGRRRTAAEQRRDRPQERDRDPVALPPGAMSGARSAGERRAPEQPPDPHLSGSDAAAHGSRQHIGRGVDDHAHSDEGQTMHRGDLRDRRALHVDRHGADVCDARCLRRHGSDRREAGEQSAAGDRPLARRATAPASRAIARGRKRVPSGAMTSLRQADGPGLERGIEPAGQPQLTSARPRRR